MTGPRRSLSTLSSSQGPQRSTLVGIALTSSAILTLEIVLTRIFSVLMWYHFAFMAISLALLGSGIAGAWLFVGQRWFSAEIAPRRLPQLALTFSGVTVACFLIFLRIPLRLSTVGNTALGGGDIAWLAIAYVVLAVPFLLGGATIALAISRYSRSVGRVYFADLVGASVGCLVSIGALTVLGGATAVLFVSLVGALAAAAFARAGGSRGQLVVALTASVVSLALVLLNRSADWIKVRTYGGYDADNRILYEKWNALARVSVYEDPYWLQPFGWGLSPTYTGPDPGHLMMLIDAKAGTPIQKWNHNLADLDYLRYDLTSLAYYLLPSADTFLIGPGGGRDIWTGRLFDANTITGVELNPAVIEAVRKVFAEYAGWVYEHPNVTVAVEDARTYLMGTDQTFDLIQASLIDTWAASSAKVFALSENGLYTQEAFLTYFDRLTDRGMVSYSRWYFAADPTEALRLVALGVSSWQRAGVVEPASHVVVMGNLSTNRSATDGLVTMLLKKTPFSAEEVATLQRLADELEFTVLFAPDGATYDNPVGRLIKAPDLNATIADYHLDITPPTDNRPFFFNFVRQGDLLSPADQPTPLYRASAEANIVLLAVLAISTLLAAVFIIGPLLVGRRALLAQPGSRASLFYFGALGVGYMLIVVPLIQRLTLYLGSPTYALAVVLFTILLGGGLGSLSTQRVAITKLARRLPIALIALIGVASALLFSLDGISQATQAWPLSARVAVVVILLFPLGLLLGQPFPLGIAWVRQRAEPIIPWLWAVNGTMSVVGSSLATILALAYGFQVVTLVGLASYGTALALAGLAWARLGAKTV